MKVSDMIKLLNEEIVLRKVNDDKVEEYAERMKAGVEFPTIKIGQWPKSDKYGDEGIVDGIHRLFAAKKAGHAEHKSEVIKFPSVQDALTYMYTANMAHGLPPTEGQRNSRINLVKKIDPTLTLEKIASQFKLSTSSIDRILKGTQKEGKGGVQTGSKRSSAHKDMSPQSAKQFFTSLEKLHYTLERKRPVADIIAYVTPEGKDGVKIDTDKRDLISNVVKFLVAIVKEIHDAK